MTKVIDSSLRKVVKGTTLVVLGSVASLLLWFPTKVFLVRNITQEEFGLYSLAITVISIAIVLANLGIREGVTRQVSVFLGEGNKTDAKAISRTSIQTGIISSIVIAVLLFAFSGPIAKHVFYKPELWPPLRAITLILPFNVLSLILIGILNSHGDIKPRVYFMDIGHPVFFLTFLSSCVLLGLPFMSVLYAYVFAMILVSSAIGIYGYKKIGLNPVSLRGGSHRWELMQFSLPLLITSMMGLFLSWTDTLMLGRYAGAEDVGVYSVSVTLAKVLTYTSGAMGFVFLPLAGELYGRRQTTELKRIYQVLTKWVFSVTLPIFFVLFFFPEMTITFLFGERYINSAIPLRILSLVFLVQALLGVQYAIFLVFRLQRQFLLFRFPVVVLNIILNYYFIKLLGLGTVGAATATMIAYFFGALVGVVFIYAMTGFQPFTAGLVKPAVGSAAIGLIIYAVAKSLPLYFWMLPLYFLLFIAGYVFSQVVTRSLDREDAFMVEAIAAKTGMELRLLRRFVQRFARP
jgi:O-antigen/teichoic acid export membrane protein